MHPNAVSHLLRCEISLWTRSAAALFSVHPSAAWPRCRSAESLSLKTRSRRRKRHRPPVLALHPTRCFSPGSPIRPPRWISNGSGPETTVNGVIRYAPGLGDAWQTGNIIAKPYPATDLKVHRCELSGLAPGTNYFFQIGTNSPVYRFRTMPAKATNAIQFVSGGDCGTNSHAIGTNILAAKQEPYFALIGGDLGIRQRAIAEDVS